MPGRSVSRGQKRARSRSRAVSRGRAGPVATRPGYRSRTWRPRRRIGFSLNTHHFSRYSEAGTLSYNGVGQAADFDFKFNQIINYSEFSTMFDQFKIDYVVIKFQLITNPDSTWATNSSGVGALGNGTNWFPKLWYVRDNDGGSSETLSSIKERQGVRFFVMKPSKEYSIKIRPFVAVQTYRTATTTGYGPRRMFLDIGNGVDVPHYGLKTVMDTLGVDPNDSYPFTVRWETKFYFTCKDVR